LRPAAVYKTNPPAARTCLASILQNEIIRPLRLTKRTAEARHFVESAVLQNEPACHEQRPGCGTVLQNEPACGADLPCQHLTKRNHSTFASYKTNCRGAAFVESAVLQNEPASPQNCLARPFTKRRSSDLSVLQNEQPRRGISSNQRFYKTNPPAMSNVRGAEPFYKTNPPPANLPCQTFYKTKYSDLYVSQNELPRCGIRRPSGFTKRTRLP
jgi:hypothetical protein